MSTLRSTTVSPPVGELGSRPHHMHMKKTPRQWLKEISTTRQRKGKDNWFTASCPICGDSRDATVLSSDTIAETAAEGKVLTHIRMTRKEYVDDDTTSAA